MEFKTEKLGQSKVKFSFIVPYEDFAQAIQKAYFKNRGKINIPGFRRGKAPLARIEAMYGKGVFFEDAFDIIFPEIYSKAVEESGIQPVSRPDIDVQKIEANSPLEFTAQVYEFPSVSLGQYEDIEVKQYVHQVSDEDIDSKLEQERKKQARKVSITEGLVEPNDLLNLDYTGSVDGVEFPGGAATGHELKIGSGQFIPGFEDQLIGMDIGTEQDIDVNFPEKYHSEDLAGKAAVFHVKLNSVEREELPELDDDFAADVSQFDTLTEYKQEIKKELEQEAQNVAENKARQAMFDQIVKNANFDLPTPMVEAQMDRMLSSMNKNMQQQGYSLDMFLGMIGQTKEEFREQYRDQATQEVSSEIVLEELIKKLDLEVSDNDVNELLDKAFDDKNALEEFKKNLTDEQKENIKYQAKSQKTVETIWKTAKVETVMGDEPKEEVLEEAQSTVE